MSEVNVSLHTKIEDKELFNFFEQGFKLLAEDQLVEAKQHFDQRSIDLSIQPNNSNWAVEFYNYDLEIQYLEVRFLAHRSQDDVLIDIVKSISKSCQCLALGVLKTEIGTGRNLAFQNGKRSSVAKAMALFGEYKAELALEIALDARRNSDIYKLLDKGMDPNIEIYGRPVVMRFLDNAKMLQAFLEKGAVLDTDKYGSLEIYSEALDVWRYKVFNLLLDAKVDPNKIVGNENQTVLDAFLSEGSGGSSFIETAEIVKKLYDLGSNPDYFIKENGSPILGFLDMIRWSLQDKKKTAKNYEKGIEYIKSVLETMSNSHAEFNLSKDNEHRQAVLDFCKEHSLDVLTQYISDTFILTEK